MFTDVVGYTALTQRDVEAARAVRMRHRAVLEKNVPKHGGEVVQFLGDGGVAAFPSAVHAVHAAVDIQREALVDATLARRHPLHVADGSRATREGRPLTSKERAAVTQASGGVSVGYRLVDLRAKRMSSGILVTGRAVRTDGAPAPGVVLLSYRLQGTITDAEGNPVRGATVVTRTPVAWRISSAVASSASAPRALTTTSTPSCASAIAHPLPSPWLAAHTMAVLPRMP